METMMEVEAPAREQFLPFALPSIGEEEIAEVVDTLRSGWVTTGPKVKRFESEFSAYTSAPHSIAVNSCTLHSPLWESGPAMKSSCLLLRFAPQQMWWFIWAPVLYSWTLARTFKFLPRP